MEIKRKILNNEQLVFYIVSFLFGCLFSFAIPAGDDVTTMRVEGGNLASYWGRSVELYRVWSSRILVNFVLCLFTDRSPVWWGIFMGFSMFVMLKAISLLVGDKIPKECNLMIACLVMLYPFRDLRTAGWIATSTTYFCPTAFGLMSLVPIKKRMAGEKLKWWEYIAYALSLIYGANNEQMMVVILACYLVSTVYFMWQRRWNPYQLLLFFMAMASCMVILFCPGNYARKHDEIQNWYPSYGMLNTIDKADLGYSTTLRWLLFGNNYFVIAICVMLMILVYKRYQNTLFRMIAVLPVCVTILLGPLKTVTVQVYPSIGHLADEISQYGLVTVENQGGLAAFGQFFIMGVVILAICIEFLLLLDNWRDILACFTLLVSGTASRMYMGFSPTIFASCYRTCEVMSFCIIVAGIATYVKNTKYISMTGRKRLQYFAYILLFFSFLEVLFLVGTSFQ